MDELVARISFVCSGWLSHGLWAEGKWSYDLSSMLLLFFVFMLFTPRFLSTLRPDYGYFPRLCDPLLYFFVYLEFLPS